MRVGNCYGLIARARIAAVVGCRPRPRDHVVASAVARSIHITARNTLDSAAVIRRCRTSGIGRIGGGAAVYRYTRRAGD